MFMGMPVLAYEIITHLLSSEIFCNRDTSTVNGPSKFLVNIKILNKISKKNYNYLEKMFKKFDKILMSKKKLDDLSI